MHIKNYDNIYVDQYWMRRERERERDKKEGHKSHKMDVILNV
jgi:hypothetical protein